MSRLSIRLTVGVVGAGLAGCGGAGGPREFAGLRIELSTSKRTHTPGEPVHITVAVTNISSAPLRLYTPACYEYALEVTGGTGTVWQGPQPSGCGANIPPPFTLAPGQMVRFTTDWDQTNLTAGGQVPSGAYTIEAWLPLSRVGDLTLTRQQARQELAAEPATVFIGG